MTYFGFLLLFVVIPIILLLALYPWKPQQDKPTRIAGTGKRAWIAIAVQIALALVYTTPWDNYLVASGVWSYNPALVAGVLLGYVPLEEYTFFVLETVLVGLCWQLLSGRIPTDGFRPSTRLRVWCSLAVAALWFASMMLLFSGWKPGTYVLTILVWALPPIIAQIAFGADVLWQHRGLVGAVILPLGLYLSFVDSLAIRAGIWTIDPAQSTGLFVGGLPLEEGIFFFVTVTLITFGLTLTLSKESQKRFPFKSREARRGARLTF